MQNLPAQFVTDLPRSLALRLTGPRTAPPEWVGPKTREILAPAKKALAAYLSPMEAAEIALILETMAALFPSAAKTEREAGMVVDAFTMVLEPYSARAVRTAFEDHVRDEIYFPKPAQIRKRAGALDAPARVAMARIDELLALPDQPPEYVAPAKMERFFDDWRRRGGGA